MKTVTKKLTLIAFVLCFALFAAFSVGSLWERAIADEPTVINLKFHNMQFQNNYQNGTNYCTSLCFLHSDDSEYGVSSGDVTSENLADFSNLLANTTYTGSENSVKYWTANTWGWPANTKSSTFRFIYLVTTAAPQTDDVVKINEGAWFVTGGTINDKYVISKDINLRFNGTAWEYFIEYTEKEIAFNKINSTWNNYEYNLQNYTRYSLLEFTGGVSSGHHGEGMDMSNLVENTTYTGSELDWNYTSSSLVYGANKENNNMLIFRTSVSPEEGDRLSIKAGAWFITGGESQDKYVINGDIELEFDGSKWIKYFNTVEVTYSAVGSLNHASYGNNFTQLTFTANITSGGSAAMDYSNLIANTTYTAKGDAVTWNYISAYHLFGVDKVNNSILFYTFSTTPPSEGDTVKINAGAFFFVGGSDKNKYVLTNDIELKFNGSGWQNANEEVYYTVSFNSGGGSAVGSIDVLEGNSVTAPENPTKAGTADSVYSFEYWYLDDENTAYDFSSAVTEDITLTAKWTETLREVVSVTFSKLNSTWNNYDYNLLGFTKYNIFEFTGGINSGHHGGGMDMSNLAENTTYTGSELEWGYISSSLIVGPNKENNNMLIFRTSVSPEDGDRLSVAAGAWFITGGELQAKYVLSDDIELVFNGSVWIKYVEYVDKEVTFNKVNSSWNNYEYDLLGFTRYSLFEFTGGVSSGHHGEGMDMSNLTENTTYTGSEIEWNYISSSLTYGADKENNMLIFRTSVSPAKGDKLSINAGAWFITGGNSCDKYFITDDIVLEFDGSAWVDYSGKEEVKFFAVNFNFNNARNYGSGDSRLTTTILDFDFTDENKPEDESEILWLGKESNPTPSVASGRISVNGVKLSEIAGAYVDYSQGFNHMMIVVPESALLPTEQYPEAKLVIEDRTIFEDSILPEVVLTLIGGQWVVGNNERAELQDDGYKTVHDMTSGNSLTVQPADTFMSVIDNEGDLDFRFTISPEVLIKDGMPSAYLNLCLKATAEQNWDGFRFYFQYDYNKMSFVLSVYDSTFIDNEEIQAGGEGIKKLASVPIGLSAKDFAAFAIQISEHDGLYDIVIVENGLKLAEIKDIEPRGDRIGNAMLLYGLNTDWTLCDYKDGDVSVPYIYLNTKDIYFLEEGDALPEPEYRIYDRTDLVEDILVETILDEDAVEDGKVKAGQWVMVLRATDNSGNTFEREIKLYVSGERKFTVTFDGKNAQECVYGSLIEEPQIPEKSATNRVYYVFDGWYNGEEKWDFANSAVTEDLNLVARFIERDVLYTVTFTGAFGEDVQIMAKYGVQIDLSFLEKAGYDVTLKQDGTVITMLIVRGDTTVEVSYTERQEESQDESEEESEQHSKKRSSSCSSSVGFSGIAISLLLLAAVVILRKKEN